MREQFYALQLREKEAQAKYTDDHPKMRQIRQQIAAARAVLSRKRRTASRSPRSPAGCTSRPNRRCWSRSRAGFAAKRGPGNCKTQLAAVRGELTKLNENEMRLAAPQRDVDLLESDYRKYATNLEQARIDQQLETQRMSNISVVQPASYEPRPVYPRRLLNLLLGICAGVFGALALPLALEQLGPSPRSPDDSQSGPSICRLRRDPRAEDCGNWSSTEEGDVRNPSQDVRAMLLTRLALAARRLARRSAASALRMLDPASSSIGSCDANGRAATARARSFR